MIGTPDANGLVMLPVAAGRAKRPSGRVLDRTPGGHVILPKTLLRVGALVIALVSAGAIPPLPTGKSAAQAGMVADLVGHAAARSPAGESYPPECSTPGGKRSHETLPLGRFPDSTAAGSRVTMTGEIACLPKKGPGPHTMECAFGLKGADGRYYGFKNLSEHDPEHRLSSGGARVEVSGTILGPEEMEGPAGRTYDIGGVIEISAIRELPE